MPLPTLGNCEGGAHTTTILGERFHPASRLSNFNSRRSGRKYCSLSQYNRVLTLRTLLAGSAASLALAFSSSSSASSSCRGGTANTHRSVFASSCSAAVPTPFASGYAYDRRSPFASSTHLFGLGLSHHNNLNSLRGGGAFDFRGGSTATRTTARRMTATTPITESTAASSEAKPLSSAGKKLTALRKRMKEVGVDAYVIPTDDPHLSEYVSDAYGRRAYLTEFHGSAGTAVVTQDGAWLWTDSRYYNEATLQLDGDYWTLMKVGQPKTPTIAKYLSELATKHRTNQESNAKTTFAIGIDPFVHPASFPQDVEDALKAAEDDLDDNDEDEETDQDTKSSTSTPLGKINTLDEHGNLVDTIWGTDRPPIPSSPFRVHPLQYAGQSVSDKITEIGKRMEEEKATLCIFPSLDDVAYLLNVRATGDVDCNPVGIAYCTVEAGEDGFVTKLYCDAEHKVNQDEAVKAHLEEAGVTIVPYETIVEDVQNHIATLKQSKKTDGTKKKAKVWLDKSRCNYAICRVIPPKNLLDKQNPVVPMKALKNKAEMEGMREAHLVDAVAMAKFMTWLEEEILVKNRQVSEVEIDLKLTGLRAQQKGFVEVSFPTIAGVGSNGAIIHYRASEESDLMKYFDKTQPVLIDSGGQYEYGTTDVTRTWHFGEDVPAEFKTYYTRVLKGHIGVDSMIWPENTPGFVIDVMARKALWEIGKDYGHGTGHGVGAALNVHEGPQSISPRWANKEPLKEGMIVSNEPGYYEDGNFGIRIENLLEIVKVKSSEDGENEAPTGGDDAEEKKEDSKKEKDGKDYLRFERLTLIPIQKSLIDVDIMTDMELDWLDAYHEEVLQKVGPLLEDGTPEKEWLVKGCAKIDRGGR